MSAIDPAGQYVEGAGKAHLNCAQYARLFNCEMHGTFNVRTGLDPLSLRPALVDHAGYHKFWLCRLAGQHYGWAIKWGGSRLPSGYLEMISKCRFPDALRRWPIHVEILAPLPREKIMRWAAGIDFFQGFDWLPAGQRAANSALVWDAIAARASFPNKDILDVGCNFGYHAFRASRAGARVVGIDTNKNVLPVARLINDHIEMQDVRFSDRLGPELPATYDIILMLSVLHQRDENYDRLEETLAFWKPLARERLFVELINPPLQGRRTEGEIDRAVGGRVLLRYRHKIRAIRKVYEIESKEV